MIENIYCGDFNLQDFIKPKTEMSTVEREEMWKVIDDMLDTKSSFETNILDKLLDKILPAEHHMIDLSFLKIPAEHKIDDTVLTYSRFEVYNYIHTNKTWTRFYNCGGELQIEFNTKRINDEYATDLPKIITDNLIEATPLFNKNTVSEKKQGYIRHYVLSIERELKNKYFSKEHYIKSQLDIIIPKDVKEYMKTKVFDDNNKFIIVESQNIVGKKFEGIRYPLFVGLNKDKFYILSNPSMEEYRKWNL